MKDQIKPDTTAEALSAEQDTASETTTSDATSDEITALEGAKDPQKESAPKVTIVDQFAQYLANALDDLKKVSSNCFKYDVLNILATITRINAEAELSQAVRINDERYMISEYVTLAQFAKLVAPRRVVISDDQEAKDLSQRSMWVMTIGKPLDPVEFQMASRRVALALRINDPKFETIHRQDSESLESASKYALVGGKVHSVSQGQFNFISIAVYQKTYYSVGVRELAYYIAFGMS